MEKINQIKQILENFDFARVETVMHMPIHPIYNDNGTIVGRQSWKLRTSTKFDVPDQYELVGLARQLLLDVATTSDEEYTYIHTGPFKAINAWGNLALEFICGEWYCED